MKMTNDLLLVKRLIDDEPKTEWGFSLPPGDDSSDTPLRGLVIAAGPGRFAKLSSAGEEVVKSLQNLVDAFHAMPDVTTGPRGINLLHWQRAEDALKEHETMGQRLPMSVKVGDTIIFSRHGFQEFKIDGQVLISMQEASVMGIIESGAVNG